MALKRRREDTRREFRRDTDTAVWGDAFDAVMLLTHELLVSLMLCPWAGGAQSPLTPRLLSALTAGCANDPQTAASVSVVLGVLACRQVVAAVPVALPAAAAPQPPGALLQAQGFGMGGQQHQQQQQPQGRLGEGALAMPPNAAPFGSAGSGTSAPSKAGVGEGGAALAATAGASAGAGAAVEGGGSRGPAESTAIPSAQESQAWAGLTALPFLPQNPSQQRDSAPPGPTGLSESDAARLAGYASALQNFPEFG